MADKPKVRKVTVATLADEFGVSLATISNAYNRPDHVSPALREEIFKRAEELGYAGPHAGARLLRTGKASAIGLIFAEDLPYAFADNAITAFLEGVSKALAEASTSLLIIPTGRTAEYVSVVRNALVDGFMLYSIPVPDPAVDLALGRKVPTLCVDGPQLESVPLISINNRAAARAAALHLINLGHHNLAVIIADNTANRHLKLSSFSDAVASPRGITQLRLQGFGDACRKHSVEAPIVVQARFNTVDAGREAAQELLASQPEVTGILCVSDLLAIGAMQHMEAADVRVPQDVSVVGFDDISRLADVRPTLTTIKQPLSDKGYIAGRTLIESINGDRPAAPIRPLKWSLEVRESTAPPQRK
jgi:DNA-binding LacI/PurR family transcriptional regulator